MPIPTQTPTMNRKRLFAFLAMAPAVWSSGQCDANGVCTVKVFSTETLALSCTKKKKSTYPKLPGLNIKNIYI
jgi:hypothetical protein